MNLDNQIKDILKQSLELIKPSNGYSNNVQLVTSGFVDTNNVTQFPSICFYEIQDSKSPTNGVFKFNTIKKYAILAFFSSNNDTFDDAYKSLKNDLICCIHKYNNVSCLLNTIPEIPYGNWYLDNIMPMQSESLIDTNSFYIAATLTISVIEDKDSFDTTIISVPSAAVISAPTNSSSVTTLQPNIVWNSITSAFTYNVQIASDSLFNSVIVDQQFLNHNAFTVDYNSVLTNNTTYYTRVRALNQAGYSDWSSTITFTTNVSTTPGTITLNHPSSITASTTAIDFSWVRDNNSTGYDLLVSSNTGFSTTAFSSLNIQGTSISANAQTSFTFNIPYYWKVRGVNSTSTGSYSNYATFVPLPDCKNNLIAEWNADTFVQTITGSVSSWVSDIGLSAVQLVGSKMPTFVQGNVTGSLSSGRSYITFNSGLNQQLTFSGGSAIYAPKFTVILIYNQLALPSFAYPFGGAAKGCFGAAIGSYLFGVFDGSNLLAASPNNSLTAGWHIRTHTNTQLWQNGTELPYTSQQTIKSTQDWSRIGARADTDTITLSGHYACIRVYAGNLNDFDRQTAERYLNSIYKIY